MSLFHLQLPIRVVATRGPLRLAVPSAASLPCHHNLPVSLGTSAPGGLRYASVKAQGQYKLKPKRTIPKKLGAKRTGDQYVIPGNIIYKQRGTLWWPGENCMMGRDHTIHAAATGYVKYYRDPARHPDRKYIGVVFNKSDVLPYPRHAERKRRLNMTAHTIVERAPEPELSASGIPTQVVRSAATGPDGKPRGPSRLLRLRDDYSYREDNWRVGRLVDLTNVTKSRGGRGGRSSRKARFRSRRWRTERMLIGQRKRLEQSGKEQDVDEWTLAAQKRAQEEKSKKAKAQQEKKKQRAEQMAKLKLANIRKSAAKKANK